MKLKSYIADAERVYSYRVKTVAPLDDIAMDRVEQAIHRYHPIEIGKVIKTMIQKNPLDFPTVSASEVYIIDLILAVPVSPSVLHQDIRCALGQPEKYVVVRGENDPMELETERLNAETDISLEAKDKGMLRTALLALTKYEEYDAVPADQLYGDDHTARFLDNQYNIAKNRKENRIDPLSPLFKFLDMPKTDADTTDYNKDIKGSPKPASLRKPVKGTDRSVSQAGNYDDDSRSYRSVYVDKNGKEKTLTRDSDGIRKN